MDRRKYSREDLLKAVDEYKNGSSSIDIAKRYGIPGSTIRNHTINPTLRLGSGRPSLLNNNQEQYLVALLKNLDCVGLRLTKKLIIRLSSEFISSVTGTVSNPILISSSFIDPSIFFLGNSVEVGRKWLRSFLNRWNSELKVLKEENMASVRRSEFSENVRRHWFEHMSRVLVDNDLLTRPHAIYSCAASGFDEKAASEMKTVFDRRIVQQKKTICLFSGELQVIRQQGKHVSGTSDSSTNFTTNIVCANATGDILPPFVIYAGKNLDPQWTCGGPDGSSFHVSSAGCITTSLFTEWFKYFIDYTKSISKPVLLIMDNHPCHISIEVMAVARQNQICLLFLPDHCTDELRPLDTMISR